MFTTTQTRRAARQHAFRPPCRRGGHPVAHRNRQQPITGLRQQAGSNVAGPPHAGAGRSTPGLPQLLQPCAQPAAAGPAPPNNTSKTAPSPCQRKSPGALRGPPPGRLLRPQTSPQRAGPSCGLQLGKVPKAEATSLRWSMGHGFGPVSAELGLQHECWAFSADNPGETGHTARVRRALEVRLICGGALFFSPELLRPMPRRALRSRPASASPSITAIPAAPGPERCLFIAGGSTGRR